MPKYPNNFYIKIEKTSCIFVKIYYNSSIEYFGILYLSNIYRKFCKKL